VQFKVQFQIFNAVNDEAEVTCSGSVFQMRAPATGKPADTRSINNARLP